MKPVLALPLLLVLAAPAYADDDHERAREALRRGEVLPLAEILARVGTRLEGRVIEVEFERDDGRYVYELEIATETGRLYEVHVDAATGAVLEHELEDD